MLLVYNLFIRLYYIGIHVLSLWNKKAGAWIVERKALFEELKTKINEGDRIIWVHCSSAGEFEQGKPLIEAFKREYPSHKILVSFFSPSGFAVAKNYQLADYITYLPLDTRNNAERFINLVKPELVVFVKYEFWYYHLSSVAFHHIPLLLVSAAFRKEQIFFKSYGRFYKQMLFLFRHIFVQDGKSLQLLQKNGITHSSISGDTRFDRVKEIEDNFLRIEFISEFIGNNKVVVAGSTWEDDEHLLASYFKKHSELKLILTPHEINQRHISSIKNSFPRCVLYSEYMIAINKKGVQVLIIDSVGLLSRLYNYASVAYIGGGFTKDGVHNVLEAAVWGKPVIFGPNYKKYREARELIKAGGGFSISTTEELNQLADDLLTNESNRQKTSKKAKAYIEENTGATKKIIWMIQEKRLLTN